MKKTNPHNGFKTPEGYFENFNQKVQAKLAAKSNEPSNAGGFTVPTDYFTNINNKILEQTTSAETPVIALKPKNNLRTLYYAAASIAAITLLYFSFIQTKTNEVNFNDVAAADIEAYFDMNELDLNAYEIAELVPVDELAINDIIDQQLNDENIIDYINNSTDSVEELNLNYNE